MDNKKRILRLVGYLAALAVICLCGSLAGLFDSASHLFRDLRISVGSLLRLVIMALFVLAFENMILLVLGVLKPRTHRGSTMITLLSSLLRYVAAVVIVCWGLTICGVDVSTVVASVGILALVIGFGAESIIADAVTGIFMLFENQYNVGDIVEVGGFRGTVRSIGIRSTSIEDAGGNVKIINNSNMTDILNRSNHVSLSVVEIGISYQTDLAAFEQQLPPLLERIYKSHRELFRAVPEYLGVETLDSSAIVLRFTADVDEADIYIGRRVLNHDLLLGFRALGVEIPFPQLDIHSR